MIQILDYKDGGILYIYSDIMHINRGIHNIDSDIIHIDSNIIHIHRGIHDIVSDKIHNKYR
jgi:hypothetical protein